MTERRHPTNRRAAAAAGALDAGGRRERNKRDKLRRIKDAARAVFLSNGYDEATTREIARRAGVALGTLFTYAANKRDLLFLVANEDFEVLARRSAAAVRGDAPLLDNLLAAFRLNYEFYAENPQLARLVLREMLFYESGPQALHFLATRAGMIALCSEIVRNAQSRDEILTREEPEFVGELIFAVYQSEVRRWLSADALSAAEGVARLKKALGIVISGLSPGSVAPIAKPRRRGR